MKQSGDLVTIVLGRVNIVNGQYTDGIVVFDDNGKISLFALNIFHYSPYDI
jgi:hypothetical protein